MDAIRLWATPWMPNTRTDEWYGAVAAELFLPDDEVGDFATAFEAAEQRVADEITAKAQALGANTVLSYELVADLWTEVDDVPGMHFKASGTAARLIPIF
jgi:uncharacterized protein YbjQ (UPF0145 family)